MESWKEEFYATDYGKSYLQHARTVGSKNGVSHTPGYKAIGTLAKGNIVNRNTNFGKSLMTSAKSNVMRGAIGMLNNARNDMFSKAGNGLSTETADKVAKINEAVDKANSILDKQQSNYTLAGSTSNKSEIKKFGNVIIDTSKAFSDPEYREDTVRAAKYRASQDAVLKKELKDLELRLSGAKMDLDYTKKTYPGGNFEREATEAYNEMLKNVENKKREILENQQAFDNLTDAINFIDKNKSK